MKKLFACAALLALAACAPMLPAPVDAINRLPVVKVGEAAPPGGDYVLHIPANVPVPVNVRAHGSLVKEGPPIKGSVTLLQDVYLYKYWASHDRKHWENSHKLMDGVFAGGFDISGLNADFKIATP